MNHIHKTFVIFGCILFSSALLHAQCELPQDLPIHTAARNGRLLELKTLVEQGADVNILNASGESPLHCAVHHGRRYVMDYLLKNGAKPNLADPQGITPLHWAIYWRRPALAKPLLDHGANPNARDKDNRTPLDWLNVHDRNAADLLELLLVNEAKPDPGEDDGHILVNSVLRIIPGSSSLLMKHGIPVTLDQAIAIGDATLVRKMVAKEPHLLGETSDIRLTSLVSAINYNKPECIRVLAKAGAPLDLKLWEGETPLIYAVSSGFIESVSMLLSLGALVDQPGQWGITPLDAAVYTSNQEIIELLRSRGARYTIHNAAGIGDTTSVRRILDQYPPLVNYTNKGKMTPLHYAAHCGKAQMIDLLISRGAIVDATNESKETPLLLALIAGHTDCVRALLNHGASTSVTSKHGQSPLALAAAKRGRLFMEILKPTTLQYSNLCDAAYNKSATDVARHLARGDDINRICGGSTPLTLSIVAYATEVTRLLLNQGADPKLPDSEGQTPIELAFAYGSHDTVLDLIRHGVDVDSRDEEGKTLLHLAIETNNIAMVRVLLERGANTNILSRDEWSDLPLNMTLRPGIKREIFDLLLAHGADVNIPGASGRTSLMSAVSMNCGDVVEVLLEHGAQINKQDDEGRTALHVASGSWSPDINTVHILLTEGADASIPDSRGRNPLMSAAESRNKDIVKILRDAGAEYDLHAAAAIGDVMWIRSLLAVNARLVNTRDGEGNTALHWAAQHAHTKSVSALLAGGAVVDSTNNRGWTPLLECANSHSSLARFPKDLEILPEQIEIARMLLERGANPNHASRDGLTPLFAVTSHYYEDFMEILLKHGAKHTPFTAAAIGDASLLREYIDQDPDCVNRRGYAGQTPIFLAARNNKADAIRLLAEKGADVDAVSEFEFNPLMEAVWKGQRDAIKALIDAGANPWLKTETGSALETARMMSVQHPGLEEFITNYLQTGK